ncbi:hypothetical protein [Kribbella sp. NPDC006257]|uniref:hypothetical protein n=1 Tax=Kribbella sp. NPDC006257 TaxID=3156738 RepID=UPI0033BEDC16
MPGTVDQAVAFEQPDSFANRTTEMTLGSFSVAVPILDSSGTAAAALGIVIHTVRADAGKLVPPLRAAADGIERRLRESADDPYPTLLHDLPRSTSPHSA